MSPAAGWAALLAGASPVFSAPSARIFVDLVTGWVLAPGRRTVTRMILAADPEGRRAHDAYHRFVRAGRWSLARLWRVLAATAVTTLCPDGAVLALDVDDTLFHRNGRRVAGAGWFRDPVRSGGGRVARSFGLNLVVVTLRITPPWAGPPIGLPINARLHRKGGPTQPEHARDMLTEIAAWFPTRSFTVAADGAYSSLLGADLARTRVYTRMRRNAALFAPAPPPTGRRGRPRTRGDRLPTPVQLAEGVDVWTTVTTDLRGRSTDMEVWSRPVLWYRVAGQALLLLVIVRDPAGQEADTYLVTDDLQASPGAVISTYSGRWSIEVTFRDTKQDLGGQDPQSWKHHGPERAAALSLWLHAAIWLWYIPTYGATATWTPRPWYPGKRTPSFHDALAALRRILWRQRITTLSSLGTTNTKTADSLIDILANAA